MEMLTFRAYTAAFADLANTTLHAACENCTHLFEAAMFEIGQHMQDLYSEWNCTDENNCLGGCLATGQLSYDALTATSEAIQPLISTRYSDIIAIHLVNPVTYELVEVTDMLVPMKLTIPLTSDPDFTTYQYVCRNWDYDNVDWSEDGCEAAMLDNSTDAWTATCYCYTTGYFAVFEGEELALLSAPSTTEFLIIEETTTAANFLDDLSEDDVDSVTIVFSIDADSALLANYSEVKADILEWLMDTMYVEEDRIENLVLSKGSIVVEFDLMSVGEGDLNVLITRLEKQVTSSSSITLLGTTYTLIPDSFSVSINENVGTSPAVSESGGLKMGVIIGVVVGCTMLIVLVVVIAVVCLKKGSGANKIQDSPRESRTHLSHAELGTYQFQPSKINPAEEALYGPAPVPHVPDTVTKSTDAPIGSRPTTSNEKRTLTPVS
ncbi:hypothetical protein EB796_016846 [Bugula neritina]|uniref:GPS domain-containing protein n=1 Tax=Bugula neritina TaxID=10212 RepID=A0A7J7JHK4_BUGNE|nr:hypothetical protein EB796_016846 [Bugula neritina]